jgi:hypothetical protein
MRWVYRELEQHYKAQTNKEANCCHVMHQRIARKLDKDTSSLPTSGEAGWLGGGGWERHA